MQGVRGAACLPDVLDLGAAAHQHKAAARPLSPRQRRAGAHDVDAGRGRQLLASEDVAPEAPVLLRGRAHTARQTLRRVLPSGAARTSRSLAVPSCRAVAEPLPWYHRHEEERARVDS